VLREFCPFGVINLHVGYPEGKDAFFFVIHAEITGGSRDCSNITIRE
jgi:hypothetical protein